MRGKLLLNRHGGEPQCGVEFASRPARHKARALRKKRQQQLQIPHPGKRVRDDSVREGAGPTGETAARALRDGFAGGLPQAPVVS